jgi:hypothetical protein
MHLSEICGPFPIKNRQLLLAAERFGFSGRVVEFLRLFPANEVFHSRDGFLESCDKLEALIRNDQQGTRQLTISVKGVRHGYYPQVRRIKQELRMAGVTSFGLTKSPVSIYRPFCTRTNI